jgi:hypothetical protein
MDGKSAIVNHFKITIYILSLVFYVCHKICLQSLSLNVTQAYKVLRFISFHSCLNFIRSIFLPSSVVVKMGMYFQKKGS